MRIQKISDVQIRCELSREDLNNAGLQLTDLAYGEEKTNQLFEDMLHRASQEFDFRSEKGPLMIEAIPRRDGSLIVLLTLVEEPDELDTRFGRFSPFEESSHISPSITIQDNDREPVSADDTISRFMDLVKAQHQKNPGSPDNTSEAETPDLISIYRFPSLDAVVQAAKIVKDLYSSHNTLYHTVSGDYELILHKGSMSPEEFNRVCNMLTEFGMVLNPYDPAVYAAALEEHEKTILAEHALQKLSDF